MKQLDVFKKIGGILKELNEQYDYLAADTSELNELELELFVANAHFLKDHAEILRRLNERAATPQPAAQPVEKPSPVAYQPKPVQPPTLPAPKHEALHEQRFFEPVVQQHIPVFVDKLELSKEAEPLVQVPFNNPVVIEVVNPLPPEEEQPVPDINIAAETDPDIFSFEREAPEAPQQVLVLEEAQTWDDEEDLFEQEELTSQLPERQAEKSPATPEPGIAPAKADTADQQVLTFNQKIMAQRAEKVNNTNAPAELPVTDLKSAINLNDKLLYIKDLFNGYSLAYSEAIEIVNRFNTYEEAERFLRTNYVVKNNWESKATTAAKFYTLLKRRYPAN